MDRSHSQNGLILGQNEFEKLSEIGFLRLFVLLPQITRSLPQGRDQVGFIRRRAVWTSLALEQKKRMK